MVSSRDPSTALGMTSGKQSSQRLQVFHIFAQIFSFRCFEDFWNFSKASIAQDETKCVEPNLSLADVFVTIKVEIPSDLSKEERGLLERLAQIRGETPKKGEGLQARLGKLGDK